MDPAASPHEPGSAHRLFAAWLARRGAAEAESLAAMLAANPDHANELRALHERWSELEPVLRLAGLDPAAPASFSQRLKVLHGEGLEPEVQLEPPSGEGSAGSSALLGNLRKQAPGGRYRVEGEVARGGMGAILRVWDGDIRRHIAMKIMLARDAPGAKGEASSEDMRMLARFLEEAQVTGQLDHPGVVPVHELGIDQDGRVFFTMKLVKGRDLRTIYELVFGRLEGWNETRALSVILRVCEAVAYAHRKGVIHRDLKPANVMVGDFGEVYVMDWGLARVVGRKDRHDVRIAPEAVSSRSVRTERRETREETPDSPIVTMDGDVVGTPAYMAPEQARGEVEQLTARTDVYAIGAMLYQLLARQMPYVPKGARVSNRTVLGMVLQGPPAPLQSLRRDLPAELVAICEKAMSRDATQRYPETLDLAEDLRAYLEHRVVRAHRTGAWAEFRKWVQRNRATAAALAGLVVTLMVGIAVPAQMRARAERRELLLIDARLAAELLSSEPRLWPALPRTRDGLQAWLADAEALAARRDEHEALLRELEAEPSAAGRATQMRELVQETAPAVEQVRPSIAERLAQALAIEERTLASAEARLRWRSAIDAILASPVYGGLRVVPQVGLLPLGPDPKSKLWEFWHVGTGAEPVRDPATGRWRITGETGIVLVLVPGGTCSIGSLEMAPPPGDAVTIQRWDEAFTLLRSSPDWGAEGRDPAHDPVDEARVDAVQLDPFFVAKHEMTKGQWLRLMHSNPSQREPQRLELPIETVSWNDAREALRRADLVLPTEAQWEYACRAGTSSPFWTGWEIGSLQGAANIADRTLSAALGSNHGREVSLEVEDGFVGLAPVDALEPNPFGLHHVHGNVWEWCRDGYRPQREPRPGDGLDLSAERSRMSGFRGGAFDSPAHESRSANRFPNYLRDNNDSDLGVRAARALEPAPADAGSAPK